MMTMSIRAMPVPTNATHLDLSYELNRTMMTMNLDDDDDDD